MASYEAEENFAHYYIVHIGIISFIYFLAVVSVLKVFTVEPGKVTKPLIEHLQDKLRVEKEWKPNPIKTADDMNKVIARHMAGVQRLPTSAAQAAKMGTFTKLLKNKLTKK